MIAGVDVSAFQGPPADWTSVAGQIDWAGVKISEYEPGGDKYVNPDAASDWAALGSLGKGRLAYLFGHPSASAAESAALFTGQLGALGIHDGDAVALDLEVNDGLGAAAVASWAADVLARLERDLDRLPVLYTFLSFAEAGNCAGLGKYPLWIADPSSPAGHPRIPAPWKTWALHQWRITGPIDRDVAAYDSLAAMRKALGKAAPVARVTDYTTNGKLSLLEVAALPAHHTAPSTILRRTAIKDGEFSAALAAYINAGDLTKPMPAGIVLRVPAAA